MNDPKFREGWEAHQQMLREKRLLELSYTPLGIALFIFGGLLSCSMIAVTVAMGFQIGFNHLNMSYVYKVTLVGFLIAYIGFWLHKRASKRYDEKLKTFADKWNCIIERQ